MTKERAGIDLRGSFRERIGNSVGVAFLAGASIFATWGCSDATAESTSEAVDVSSEAFTDYNWTYVEQSRAYAFAYDMACGLHALGHTVTCSARNQPVFQGGSTPIGYADGPGDPAVTSGFDYGHGVLERFNADGMAIGDTAKSIALEDVSGTVCVYVLGSDSTTWVSCGGAYSNWPNGTDFAKYTKLAAPITSTGATVCLRKIVEVLPPNAYGPSTSLVALSCDGKIYQAAHPGSSWVWVPGNTIAPWNMLPSRTWSDISDGDASVGTFLISSTNEIWIAGIGYQPVGGAVTYYAPTHTGTLFTNGLAYAPRSIGKSVVIASDSTIWRYTASINKWNRTGLGIPVGATSLNNISNVSDFFGQFAVAAIDDISHLNYHF